MDVLGHAHVLAYQQGEMTELKYDRHLVPIKPEVLSRQGCPVCGSDAVLVEKVVFPGIHVMAKARCNACNADYLQDLPVGFAVDHAMAIDVRNGQLIKSDPKLDWIQGPLLKGYARPEEKDVAVERVVYRSCKNVIVLNTLDFLYGHVLLKLYNAAHCLQRYPDVGLIVIVPRMFQWLVPKGVAEAWVVDLRLGQMQGWYSGIDRFVQEQLPRYTTVQLARGYAHPVFANIDVEAFTGVAAFPIEKFSTRPAHITFVAREDRLWFAGPIGKFMYRLLNKLGMKESLGRWYVKAQDRLIRSSMQRIRMAMPDVRFTVVGLAAGGGLSDVASDLRTKRMDDAVERSWVEAYAASQIVVGVHGSNMLLPTAHAAGCIEILPYDRYGNIVQDISVRRHDRMQLFLYRFVDEFATPATIAHQAVAMFREFDNYYRNNVINGFGNPPE
jgi:hypothetical protein